MIEATRHSAVTVFLRLAATALAAIAGGSAHAQTVYPERVIKMIVPSPAGGQTDVMARLMAQKMQQSLGQSVIIENRAGAGGALGARTAAAANLTAITLLYGNASTLAVIPASLFITRPARSEMTVTGSVLVKLPPNKPIAKAMIKQTATIIAKPVSGRTALLFIGAPPSPTG